MSMNSMIPPASFIPPEDWIANAHTEHGKKLYRYNLRGKIEPIDCECRCITCLTTELSRCRIGPPTQVHDDYDTEELEKMGYVGVYKAVG